MDKNGKFFDMALSDERARIHMEWPDTVSLESLMFFEEVLEIQLASVRTARTRKEAQIAREAELADAEAAAKAHQNAETADSEGGNHD